jgi:hypothetical protein
MRFEEPQLIMCGRCRVAVEVSASSACETRVCCPSCGESDTLEEARREAGQHTAHRLLSVMLRGLRTDDRPELYFRFVEGGESRAGLRPALA